MWETGWQSERRASEGGQAIEPEFPGDEVRDPQIESALQADPGALGQHHRLIQPLLLVLSPRGHEMTVSSASAWMATIVSATSMPLPRRTST